MTLTKQDKIEKLADFFTNKFKPYFFTTLGKLSKKKYSKISNKNHVNDSLSDIWNFLINLWNNISCTSYSSVSELKKKISKIISKLKPSFIDILYEYFIGKEEKKKNNGGGDEQNIARAIKLSEQEAQKAQAQAQAKEQKNLALALQISKKEHNERERQELEKILNLISKKQQEQNALSLQEIIRQIQEFKKREEELNIQDSIKQVTEAIKADINKNPFNILIPNGDNGTPACWLNSVLIAIICNQSLFNYTNLNTTSYTNPIITLENNLFNLQLNTIGKNRVWTKNLYDNILKLIKEIPQSSNPHNIKGVLYEVIQKLSCNSKEDAYLIFKYLQEILKNSSNNEISEIFMNLELTYGYETNPNSNNLSALIPPNDDYILIGFIKSTGHARNPSHWHTYLRLNPNLQAYVEIDMIRNPTGHINDNMIKMLNFDETLNKGAAYIGIFVPKSLVRNRGFHLY